MDAVCVGLIGGQGISRVHAVPCSQQQLDRLRTSGSSVAPDCERLRMWHLG